MSTREVIIVGFGIMVPTEEAQKRWPELEDCTHPLEEWRKSDERPLSIIGGKEDYYFVGKVFAYADLYNSDSLLFGSMPMLHEIIMDEKFVEAYVQFGIEPEQMVNEGRYYANTHCF